MIDQKLVVELFAKMRQATDWDVNGNLLWGYYFLAPEQSPLMRLAGKLREEGYRYVGFLDGDPSAGETLHVEKVETHTADTLKVRNADLSEKAQRFGCSYDGFDVGLPVLGKRKPKTAKPVAAKKKAAKKGAVKTAAKKSVKKSGKTVSKKASRRTPVKGKVKTKALKAKPAKKGLKPVKKAVAKKKVVKTRQKQGR